ncbi:MAG TPA: hypothetical protein VLM89_03535 [Phycisphaerae bacterium]|nr:hypothetical protein [Phycisphaerae bacterium]
MRTRMIIISGLWLGVVLGGCESPGGSGGLLDLGQSGSEKWTIRCLHAEGPEHQLQAGLLADHLRKVRELRADRIRLVSTSNDSTIYYGQYVKVPSPETGRLIFPPEYLRDLAVIQRTTYNGQQYFRYAKPELLETGSVTAGIEQWDVANAKGRYTLQIAVFYNTPTFTERKEASEQYCKLLRQDGFVAYYRHEPARSFVFVGDFDESDIVKTPEGFKAGPRVEKLIRQREEEFRHTLENGYKIKRKAPDGQMVVPPSMLIPLPDKEVGQ